MDSGDGEPVRTCTYCGRTCECDHSRCPRCGNVFTKERKG